MFTVVSYYTLDTPYEQEVRTLIDSCQRFGVAHDIRGVEDLGSWQANTRHKAAFLRELRAELRGPIVWLDADAEVKAYPTAFDVLEGAADVAVHYRHSAECLSGTVWLADNDAARALLDKWAWYCAKRPESWDQNNLDAAIGALHGLRVHRLPAAYCCIFDAGDMLAEGPAVIEHHQASRRFKKRVSG